jgi:Family of unknown function (DUF6695)
MIKLPKILPAPELSSKIPSNAKWLAGEGAGSWFVIKKTNFTNYRITRLSPEGNFECENVFTAESRFNVENDYIITVPSHCSVVTIIQGHKKICFKAVSNQS